MSIAAKRENAKRHPVVYRRKNELFVLEADQLDQATRLDDRAKEQLRRVIRGDSLRQHQASTTTWIVRYGAQFREHSICVDATASRERIATGRCQEQSGSIDGAKRLNVLAV